MKASDVMTRSVRTASQETPVRDLAQMMVRHRISAVPIVAQGRRIVGIVSEGDLLRRQETGTARKRRNWLDFFVDPGSKAPDFVKSHARRAGDVMTRPVVSVTADTPLSEIADLFERRRIKRVPVVRGGRVVGIVSRHDLVGALAKASDKGKSGRMAASDRDIRAAVERELKKQSWADFGQVNATVQKGVVEVWGIAPDKPRRDALRVALENVAGVRAVRGDHLVVLPLSAYAT